MSISSTNPSPINIKTVTCDLLSYLSISQYTHIQTCKISNYFANLLLIKCNKFVISKYQEPSTNILMNKMNRVLNIHTYIGAFVTPIKALDTCKYDDVLYFINFLLFSIPPFDLSHVSYSVL